MAPVGDLIVAAQQISGAGGVAISTTFDNTRAVPGETSRPLWHRHGLIGLLRPGAAHAIR
ncbi:hypothetical protein A4G27_11345 [Mycobacterium kansasii]|nr:hypothetical protein A4G27_11345 [Mycobacterium kansasii]